MSQPPVLITGAGLVSALGPDASSGAAAALRGESGIELRRWEDLEIPAGSVRDPWITAGSSRMHDRTTMLALTAAQEAATQARLDPEHRFPRGGCIVGTGLGGVGSSEIAYEKYYRQGSSRLHPLSIPLAMYNAPTSAVSAAYGLEGPSFATVSACTSGTHAVIQGAAWIRSGLADLVVCGGADAPLWPAVVTAWKALRVLASPGADASRACRPFSADRDGLVLAEGAAIVVLESEAHAGRRGASAIGSILGIGMSSDAGHLTDPSVRGPVRAMRLALENAGMDPSEVGYINAHGTATKANDRTESAAITEIFGPESRQPPVSSTKALHGHAMGATGSVELVLCLRAMSQGSILPAMHRNVPDPECSLRFPSPEEKTSNRTFLSSSFGFGGMNGCIVARAGD